MTLKSWFGNESGVQLTSYDCDIETSYDLSEGRMVLFQQIKLGTIEEVKAVLQYVSSQLPFLA
jgi:hypothetical protein